MAFTRAGNRDAFLERSGYLDIENLQRDIESGGLLQRYDLDTPQNRTRYHKNTAPLLVGRASLAPNGPFPADTLDHLTVDQLNPAAATSPGYNLGAMLLQYVPLRDCFYHRDKQREVAKGLDDLYKELQRVQNNVVAPHPTNPGLVVTTKRKLTASEAGKIIGQRRYHASRATLEQLAVELGYVGEVDVQTAVPVPYGMAAPPVAPGAPVYRPATPDAIRAAYQQPLSLTNALQRIPEGVLAVIRDTALISGAIAGSGFGLAAGGAYLAAKGGQIVAGLAASGISHVARRGAADYITSEDGLQNFAQFTGKVGGLAAYSATASLATATLAVGWVTGTLAGSAVTRYVANRKRQNAREKRSRLENTLQAGGIDAALAAQIQNDVRSAERYEAASAGFDIASLLGSVGGSLYAAFGGTWGSPDTEKPTITRTEFNEGSTTHTFNKATTPTLGFEVDATDDHGIDKITAYVHKVGSTQAQALQVIQIYPDNIQDSAQHALGINTIKDGGEITLSGLSPGNYIINAKATDFAGHDSLLEPVGSFTVVDGTGPVPPGPIPPVPPAPGPHPPSPTPEPHPGPSPIPGTTDYADWDIRRTYDDHGHVTKPMNYADIQSSYKDGAAHENAISFDKATKIGHINLDAVDCDKQHMKTDPHGLHTDGEHNYKVFFEGYEQKDFDPQHAGLETRLTTARMIDIDPAGNYVLPSDIDLSKFSGYQVWFADVNHEDATSKTLCVEALASYNVDTDGKGPLGYLVEKEEACHSGSGHGDAPGQPTAHILDLQPQAEPTHFVAYDSRDDPMQYRVVEGNYYHGLVGNLQGNADIRFPEPQIAGDYTMKIELSDLAQDPAPMDVETVNFHIDPSQVHHVAVGPEPANTPIVDATVLPADGALDATVAPDHSAPATIGAPAGESGTQLPEGGALPADIQMDELTLNYHADEILYVDEEAIAAFLREHYSNIDYKQVA